MNILFTICARAGSKGVSGKNTKIFCERPLVTYTLAAYSLFCEKYSGQAENICLAVNTDSELLLQQVNESGVEYLCIPRTDELAGDLVGKEDVISDTLKKSEEKKGVVFDVLIDLDLTSPLRTVADIKGTLDTLLGDENADIAYSVTGARRLPYFNMVKKSETGYYQSIIKTDFIARQQAPACYDMNASIYAYRRDYLLHFADRDSKDLIWMMEDSGVLDIDSENDFELMEVVGTYFYEKKDEYAEIRNYCKKKGW